jgi:hypothetical protein
LAMLLTTQTHPFDPSLHALVGTNWDYSEKSIDASCMHSSPYLFPKYFKFIWNPNKPYHWLVQQPPLSLVVMHCSSTLSPLSFSVWKRERKIHANLVT